MVNCEVFARLSMLVLAFLILASAGRFLPDSPILTFGGVICSAFLCFYSLAPWGGEIDYYDDE